MKNLRSRKTNVSTVHETTGSDYPQALEIIEKKLAEPVTDNVSACLIEETTHHVRFSNNEINRENLKKKLATLTVSVGYKKRTGSYKTNDLSPEGISHAFDMALENAKHLPEDPEYMPAITKKEATRVKAYSMKYVPATDSERYELLHKVFSYIRKNRLTGAGNLFDTRTFTTTMNNCGVRLSHEERNVGLNITAMTKTSSFKSTYLGNDFTGLELEKFMPSLIEKTRLSENPVPVPPGRYTVVLTPRAVGELLIYMMWYNFDAKAIDEKRTAIYPRLGKTIANRAIHIFSDPSHPLCPAIPFSPLDGRPLTKFDMLRDGKFIDGWYSRFWEKKKRVKVKGKWPANIIFEGTDQSEEDLIKKVKEGLFVNSFWYIRLVDLMDGIFTGMTRDGLFIIKNGKLEKSAINFRFNQNVFDLLLNTADIGQAERTEYGVFPYLTVKDFNMVSTTEF